MMKLLPILFALAFPLIAIAAPPEFSVSERYTVTSLFEAKEHLLTAIVLDGETGEKYRLIPGHGKNDMLLLSIFIIDGDTYALAKIDRENILLPVEADTSEVTYKDWEAQHIEQFLTNVTVPYVKFEKTKLDEAIAQYLEAAENQMPPEVLQKGGIGIRCYFEGNDLPIVSLTLRNLSLKKALYFIAEAGGYDYTIEDEALRFAPVTR